MSSIFLLFFFPFYFIFNIRLEFQYNITITTVTQICDTKKVVEGSGTNNIIQHSNNMLALWNIEFFCVTQYKGCLLPLLKGLSYNKYLRKLEKN